MSAHRGNRGGTQIPAPPRAQPLTASPDRGADAAVPRPPAALLLPGLPAAAPHLSPRLGLGVALWARGGSGVGGDGTVGTVNRGEGEAGGFPGLGRQGTDSLDFRGAGSKSRTRKMGSVFGGTGAEPGVFTLSDTPALFYLKMGRHQVTQAEVQLPTSQSAGVTGLHPQPHNGLFHVPAINSKVLRMFPTDICGTRGFCTSHAVPIVTTQAPLICSASTRGPGLNVPFSGTAAHHGIFIASNA